MGKLDMILTVIAVMIGGIVVYGFSGGVANKRLDTSHRIKQGIWAFVGLGIIAAIASHIMR